MRNFHICKILILYKSHPLSLSWSNCINSTMVNMFWYRHLWSKDNCLDASGNFHFRVFEIYRYFSRLSEVKDHGELWKFDINFLSVFHRSISYHLATNHVCHKQSARTIPVSHRHDKVKIIFWQVYSTLQSIYDCSE